MGDSKQKQFKPKKTKYTQMTPEQKAAHAAQVAAAEIVRKAEEERVNLYGTALEKMSHRQLRKELTKTIKREYSGRPPEPQAGLTIGIATILLNVLDHTHTAENPFAKLASYPR